jgi:hypothetical protein
VRPNGSAHGGSGHFGGRRFVGAFALLVALGVFATIPIASGSAATSGKPYTAVFDANVAGGKTSVAVNLAITNNAKQSLGSAQVTAPPTFSISGPAQYVDPSRSNSTVLTMTNLNVAAGATLNIPITVAMTPCPAGAYAWSISAKQSNDYNGTGNDFTFTTNGSNLITNVTPCTLKWVTQPATSAKNATITGALYNPSGPSVAVQAYDGGNPALPIATLNTGGVTLTQTGGSGPGSFSGTSANFSGGVATFATLSAANTGTGFTLDASSAGFVNAGNSGPFNINLGGCAGANCAIPSTPLNNDLQVGVSSSGGSFTFLTLDPFGLGSVPAGCQYYTSPGNGGFSLTEGRTSNTGDLTFTYSIRTSLIPGDGDHDFDDTYIPLCAGGQRVNANGQPIPCTQDPGAGWKGRTLTSTGEFGFGFKNAICDAASGLWWGILGTSLDSHFIPSGNPIITGFTDDATYRNYTIKVPAPWDWKMG